MEKKIFMIDFEGSFKIGSRTKLIKLSGLYFVGPVKSKALPDSMYGEHFS